MFAFLGLQDDLRAAADAMGMRFFNITIKSYDLAHIALRAHGLNPTLAWCYVGEDFMQQMKKLAKTCVQGNHTHDVPFKLVEKYMRGLSALFDRGSLFI